MFNPPSSPRHPSPAARVPCCVGERRSRPRLGRCRRRGAGRVAVGLPSGLLGRNDRGGIRSCRAPAPCFGRLILLETSASIATRPGLMKRSSSGYRVSVALMLILVSETPYPHSSTALRAEQVWADGPAAVCARHGILTGVVAASGESVTAHTPGLAGTFSPE